MIYLEYSFSGFNDESSVEILIAMLNDMSAYSDTLAPDGTLIISGILVQDKEVIVEQAKQCGLIYKSQMKENNWLSIIFEKEEGI